jgi:hypothetical protein
MPTSIQILRSYANDAPTILNDGELAFSFTANALYIGDQSNNIILIGGTKLIENVTVSSANTANVANISFVSYETLSADGGEF